MPAAFLFSFIKIAGFWLHYNDEIWWETRTTAKRETGFSSAHRPSCICDVRIVPVCVCLCVFLIFDCCFRLPANGIHFICNIYVWILIWFYLRNYVGTHLVCMCACVCKLISYVWFFNSWYASHMKMKMFFPVF